MKTIIAEAQATTNPNLALIKYWGKHELSSIPSDSLLNLPATPSLGIALEGLESITKVQLVSGNSTELFINGEIHSPERVLPLQKYITNKLGCNVGILAESYNNFPTAAGLASSSSGLASLTLAGLQALSKCTENEVSLSVASSLARQGSGSAARAVYGGFCQFPAQSNRAYPWHSSSYWPALRVLVVEIDSEKKEISSREAMKRSANTSSVYSTWLEHSQSLYEQALEAVENRNLNHLGPLMVESYQLMFSTMLTARPPIYYWKPSSLQLIQSLQKWRNEGLQAWETMDAGPQVKILTLDDQVPFLKKKLAELLPNSIVRSCRLASSPVYD